MDALARLAQNGQMLAKFRGATARQDGDELFLRIEALLAEKCLTIEGGVHGAYQRMTDEFHGDSGIAVELFFKGENAECLREAATHYAHAPGAPGPELRADVIDVADSMRLEFSGEAEVEAVKIGEDGESGFAALGFEDEAAHGADQRGEMAEDFGDADDGNFGVFSDDV